MVLIVLLLLSTIFSTLAPSSYAIHPNALILCLKTLVCLTQLCHFSNQNMRFSILQAILLNSYKTNIFIESEKFNADRNYLCTFESELTWTWILINLRWSTLLIVEIIFEKVNDYEKFQSKKWKFMIYLVMPFFSRRFEYKFYLLGIRSKKSLCLEFDFTMTS